MLIGNINSRIIQTMVVVITIKEVVNIEVTVITHNGSKMVTTLSMLVTGRDIIIISRPDLMKRIHTSNGHLLHIHIVTPTLLLRILNILIQPRMNHMEVTDHLLIILL